VDPEDSLPHVQAPANCPYPEPDQSSPSSLSHFLQSHSTPRAKSQVRFPLLDLYQRSNPSLGLCETFRSVRCYGEELLALRPIPKLDDNPLSAVYACLFDIFAATFHFWRHFLHPQPEDEPCCRERSDLYRLCSAFASSSRLFQPVPLAARSEAVVTLHPYLADILHWHTRPTTAEQTNAFR